MLAKQCLLVKGCLRGIRLATIESLKSEVEACIRSATGYLLARSGASLL